MTPDTVFDLASLTKPLVGAGVALALVDRGAFSLDEEITDVAAGAGSVPRRGCHGAPVARPHRRRHRLAAGVHRR